LTVIWLQTQYSRGAVTQIKNVNKLSTRFKLESFQLLTNNGKYSVVFCYYPWIWIRKTDRPYWTDQLSNNCWKYGIKCNL